MIDTPTSATALAIIVSVEGCSPRQIQEMNAAMNGIAAMIMKALAIDVYWNAAGKRTMVAARLSAVA